METPKIICVLMNALLKDSRKWLIVIFCFFMSMPLAFAQATSDHPYYNSKDGQWYSFWDTQFRHGRYAFTETINLTNCYRPFYMLSVDIVGLANPEKDGKFESNTDIYIKVDNQYVWLASATKKHAGKTWSGTATTGQVTDNCKWVILNESSDFCCSMLDYSYFKSRTAADGTRYNASKSAYKSASAYYKSNTGGNTDNDDVVLDFLKYFQVDYPTLKNTKKDFGSVQRRQTTADSGKSNHTFRDQYGDKPYARFNIDCKTLNIGLNPEVIYIGKEGDSQVGRIVMDSIRAKLAPHLVLQSDDDKTLVTEKTIHYTATAVNTSTGEEFMPFRSFLLDGSWKVVLTFDDDDNKPGTAAGTAHSIETAFQAFEIQFKNSPNPSSTSYTTIDSENTITTLIDHTNINGQICGYQGSIYNAATNPAYDPSQFIKVSFVADTTCTRIATLTFYDDNYYTYNTTTNELVEKTGTADGMPHSVTIKLSGEYKKAPELKWLANNNIIEKNGTLDVTYGHGPMSTGTLALPAYPYKDSERDTRLQANQTPCPSNGTIKYFLVDDKGNEYTEYNGFTIDQNGNITAPDVTAGLTSKDDLKAAKEVVSVKVKAVIEATTECKAETSYITVNVHPKHVILTEAKLNTAMCNYDLSANGWAVSNYDSPVTFGEFATEDGTTDFVYHNALAQDHKSITLFHTGKVTMSASSANTDHGTASLAKKDFDVVPGTLYFQNGAGDWSETSHWYSHESGEEGVGVNYGCVPLGENHNVVINSNCTVSTPNGLTPETTPSGIKALGDFIDGPEIAEGEEWTANSADIKDGSLTIKPNGAAHIFGTLSIHPNYKDSYNKIFVEASESNQGCLIFGSGAPKATVEIVSVGTKGEMDPIWQYRGIPVDVFNSISFDNNGNDPMIYEWTEMLQSNPLGNGINEHWIKTNNEIDGWKGYAFGRLKCTSDYYTSTVTGTLTAANRPVALAYTNVDENSNNVGMNLITNSYTAAIDVASLETTDFGGAEATLFIYNQGTYNDYKDYWDADDDHSGIWGNTSSQVSTYPIFSGADATGATISVIPSGQSFFVKTNSTGKSFNFRPGMLKQQDNGAALKAPREAEQFNILTIKVEGGDMKDRVVMMENDNCSRGFDNGYDGSKFFMDGVPQIYATNEFGRTDINCDAVMAGNYIGFAAAKNGVKYTISFDTDRLEGYNKLFLYDTQNGRYIDILAGETYEFTGKHSGEDRRFILMGEREDGSSFTGADKRIEVIGDHAVVCGFDGMDETILISDLSGRVWWQGNTRDGALVQIPSDLAKGVYVISVDKCNTKFVK